MLQLPTHDMCRWANSGADCSLSFRAAIQVEAHARGSSVHREPSQLFGAPLKPDSGFGIPLKAGRPARPCLTAEPFAGLPGRRSPSPPPAAVDPVCRQPPYNPSIRQPVSILESDRSPERSRCADVLRPLISNQSLERSVLCVRQIPSPEHEGPLAVGASEGDASTEYAVRRL